ncbi:hypothetical protein KCU81_g3772, partial [Aureobasidium melanogenum]|uniref:Uncharacterized protein n=1 Tax=Aureobasidium melanogenum (strain CBS 110374) TaxID=1043003 RepID=A0A074WKV7_AURM1
MSLNGEYQIASWSEIFCQCLPIGNKKPAAGPDIEMQKMSASSRYSAINNPVIPDNVVSANNPDNIQRPSHTSWWLRDDSSSFPSAPPSRSGAMNPVASYLDPTPGPTGIRTPPRTTDPYTSPSHVRSSIDMFVHNPYSPGAPAPRTPQWVSRVEWAETTSPRLASSVYPVSDSEFSSGPSWRLPAPSSIYSSDAADYTPTPDPRLGVRVPSISPRAASYAAILDVQADIDARRSEVVSPAGQTSPSPTGSVDSIDFFTGEASRPDFGERVERCGGRTAPVRPPRFAGTSPYIA